LLALNGIHLVLYVYFITDAAKTAFKLINRKSKMDSLNNEEGIKPEKMNGDVRFENVSFHYPNRPSQKIFNGFNMSVKSGETNALVGTSGMFYCK
jgi:ATP-binding cassette subfamily B (MDR/TAP) protein 1